MGVAAEVGELERSTLNERERGEAGSDPVCVDRCVRGFGGEVGRGLTVEGGMGVVSSAPGLGGADPVHGPAVGHREYP